MIFRICGVAILSAICAFLLRGFGWRGVPIFVAGVSVLLICELEGRIEYVFGALKEIGEGTGVSETLASALKVLAAGYLFGICADICRELGESGVAKAVDVVGRVEIIAIVIPYFEEIIKIGIELIE